MINKDKNIIKKELKNRTFKDKKKGLEDKDNNSYNYSIKKDKGCIIKEWW